MDTQFFNDNYLIFSLCLCGRKLRNFPLISVVHKLFTKRNSKGLEQGTVLCRKSSFFSYSTLADVVFIPLTSVRMFCLLSLQFEIFKNILVKFDALTCPKGELFRKAIGPLPTWGGSSNTSNISKKIFYYFQSNTYLKNLENFAKARPFSETVFLFTLSCDK